MCAKKPQRGITLIELIVFIVVVGVALAGVLTSLNVASRSSADPLQPKQALAIAESFLAEVLARNFCDPNATGTDYSGTKPVCGTNLAEGNRSDYDAVDDYHNFAQTNATSLTGNYTFTGYSVAIAVTDTTLGVTGSTADVKQVRVTVTPPNGIAVTLTGYRANY